MSGHDTAAVTVTARQESRWRCGVQFTGTPQSFPAGHWSEEQLERLRADPMLVVTEGAAAPAADGLPTTPTVEAALDTALSALRQATPEQARAFFHAMAQDPEIAPKIDGGARRSALVAAIDELEEGNEDHWTKGRRPQVSALEAASGLDDVSAAERDAAFEQWLKVTGRDLTGG